MKHIDSNNFHFHCAAHKIYITVNSKSSINSIDKFKKAN